MYLIPLCCACKWVPRGALRMCKGQSASYCWRACVPLQPYFASPVWLHSSSRGAACREPVILWGRYRRGAYSQSVNVLYVSCIWYDYIQYLYCIVHVYALFVSFHFLLHSILTEQLDSLVSSILYHFRMFRWNMLQDIRIISHLRSQGHPWGHRVD